MSSSGSSPGPKVAVATRQAKLRGVTARLDPRVNAYRPDLADIALAGQVIAPRYAAPVVMRARMATVAMHGSPDPTSTCTSELLWGESFRVFDHAAGWAWGQGEDDYVGWVREADLGPIGPAATHRITAPQALLFAGPSIKSAVTATLPLGSAVVAVDDDTDFLAVGNAFVHCRHVAPVTGDIVDLAQAFVGTPYRWGGRTRAGVDCSGLVQIVLAAHGITCPRDSDQQFADFLAVAPGDQRRGDLVAFPGHVGILVDPERLLHANAFHMTTLVEPLAAVIARLEPLFADPVLGIVRPPCGPMGASL